MILLLAILATGSAPASVERVSVATDRTEADSPCEWPSVSADGRFVAFGSAAGNLARGGKKRRSDVFVRDRTSGTTEIVSVGRGSQAGNLDSYMPSISGDGRYVAFVSLASNFAPGDSKGTWDVFVRDRKEGSTQCASLDLKGDPGQGTAGYPAISSDGRYVAFQSDAHGLVAAPTPDCFQVYVRDLSAQTTVCASVTTSGAPGATWSSWPSISGDGRYVAFGGSAGLDGGSEFPSGHVFVRDLSSGTTIRASRNSSGAEANGTCDWASISRDGRFVAFQSTATNLGAGKTSHTNVYLRDLTQGTTTWVSRGREGAVLDGASSMPFVSPDGRYVAFTSWASNLLAKDASGFADVFRWDRESGGTRLVSAGVHGGPGNGSSRGFGLSSSGQVVFESEAKDLVQADANGVADIFLAEP